MKIKKERCSMMKKILGTVLAGLAIFAGVMVAVNNIDEEIEEPMKAVEATDMIKENTPYADEYDFFTYKITEVIGDEINGLGLDNDGGIVLSKKYDNVDLKEGDIITVVFEAGTEDVIVDVQKLVMVEDGSYAPEGFYQ
jgi:hypothetical protein